MHALALFVACIFFPAAYGQYLVFQYFPPSGSGSMDCNIAPNSVRSEYFPLGPCFPTSASEYYPIGTNTSLYRSQKNSYDEATGVALAQLSSSINCDFGSIGTTELTSRNDVGICFPFLYEGSLLVLLANNVSNILLSNAYTVIGTDSCDVNAHISSFNEYRIGECIADQQGENSSHVYTCSGTSFSDTFYPANYDCTGPSSQTNFEASSCMNNKTYICSAASITSSTSGSSAHDSTITTSSSSTTTSSSLLGTALSSTSSSSLSSSSSRTSSSSTGSANDGARTLIGFLVPLFVSISAVVCL
eukprot:TRINITY_DN6561_c0_g3_i1.p1 TRINITY_DN6561_c0_g3~~TRINITY_DN6561_c0_g3_i1.p1  ORF type:complete len:303 (+),score=33.51 TRINITY_DN6561_c0_g3_i1:21-929(+)